MQQRKNVKAVAESLGTHQDAHQDEINIDCPLRFTVEKLVRDLDPQTQKPIWKKKAVAYCLQYEKGKVRRQLRLEDNKLVCEICSLLREHEATQPAPAPVEQIEPTPLRPVIEQPLSTVEVQPTKPAIRAEQKTVNSWQCPHRPEGELVHYTVCLTACKEKHNAAYMECIYLHPDIALNLAYWQKQERLSKTPLSQRFIP
ncbi:MAG: hypothetical protein ACQCN3_00800 [Candidatus Bathyarchaeia archaeon]